MIVYFDTSAFVPLLVEEGGSALCGALWDGADRVVTTRLTYVEAAAALAMAARLGRISADEHQAALDRLDVLWREFDVVELGEALMAAAATAARSQQLRGYDAVHFAAASALRDPELVAAAGDGRLLSTWRAIDIAVADVGGQPPANG